MAFFDITNKPRPRAWWYFLRAFMNENPYGYTSLLSSLILPNSIMELQFQVNEISVTTSRLPNRETFIKWPDFCLVIRKGSTISKPVFIVLSSNYFSQNWNLLHEIKFRKSFEHKLDVAVKLKTSFDIVLPLKYVWPVKAGKGKIWMLDILLCANF